MHQRRERRTNEGKSLKLKMKVNKSAHDKGGTHGISER